MNIVPSVARDRALTLVELLVVIAGLAILVCYFVILGAILPEHNARARALRIQCVNNLKYTGQAFDLWAKDHGEKFPMERSQTNGGTMEFTTGPNEWRHFQVMSNELSTPRVLVCPADVRAEVHATNFARFNNSNISYFINLDFSRPSPQVIWSGDRNLTNGTPIRDAVLELTTNSPAAWTAEMHRREGNLLTFDGSVHRVDDVSLRNAIANSGVSTNRVQMPVLTP